MEAKDLKVIKKIMILLFTYYRTEAEEKIYFQ
jgi:hypothetical protein